MSGSALLSVLTVEATELVAGAETARREAKWRKARQCINCLTLNFEGIVIISSRIKDTVPASECCTCGSEVVETLTYVLHREHQDESVRDEERLSLENKVHLRP